MSCDVGEVTESLENEQSSYNENPKNLDNSHHKCLLGKTEIGTRVPSRNR